MGDSFEKKDKLVKPNADKPEAESIGTPVDMTPNPAIPPLHQNEKLDARAMLEALQPKSQDNQDDKDEDETPPPIDKTTSSGK